MNFSSIKRNDETLGLDILHNITKCPHQLRVDLEDSYGNTRYASYKYDCLILFLDKNIS